MTLNDDTIKINGMFVMLTKSLNKTFDVFKTNIENMLTKMRIALQGCQNNVGMLRPCQDNTKMEH
jgi:hypothetical protein